MALISKICQYGIVINDFVNSHYLSCGTEIENISHRLTGQIRVHTCIRDQWSFVI
jgi:hypothetical protein